MSLLTSSPTGVPNEVSVQLGFCSSVSLFFRKFAVFRIVIVKQLPPFPLITEYMHLIKPMKYFRKCKTHSALQQDCSPIISGVLMSLEIFALLTLLTLAAISTPHGIIQLRHSWDICEKLRLTKSIYRYK